MRKKIKYWGMAFVVFLLLTQDIKADENAVNSFRFAKKGTKSVTIPFEMVNNLIIIPLHVNGSDTLRFILDTGVNKTIITSLNFNGSLELNKYREVQLSGLGGGDAIPAVISEGNEVTLANILGKNQEVYVLLQDIFHLSESLGTQVHGLIGFSVFKNFVVEIDYGRMKLILHNPDRFKYKGKGERMPISIEKSKPYVNASALQADGSRLKVKMLIDTGASHAVSLYNYDEENITIPEKCFRSFLGRGLNGDIHGSIGRIKAFQLGSHKLSAPVVNYPDKEDIAIALKLSDRSGSIGSDLLKRFRVIFNYQEEEMIIERGKYYKKEFSYNMSGIDVSTPVLGVNFYTVSHVRTGSPADIIGVKRGDDIVSVNGSSVNKYKLKELISLFQAKANKKIKLVVMRNGQKLKFTFVLKDVI